MNDVKIKLLNPQKKILLTLAIHKEFEQYKMGEKTGFNYRTILRNLKPLEKMKMINHRKEPSAKGGKDKKIYKLTFKGLMHILPMPKPWKDEKILKKVITTHSDKLLTFKKWDLFKKNNLEKDMIGFLANAFLKIIRTNRAYDLRGLQSYYESEAKWKEATDALILFPPLFLEHNEIFIKVFKQDEELTEFIDSLIKKQEKEYLAFLGLKEQWSSFPSS